MLVFTLYQGIFQHNIGKTGSPFGLQRGSQPGRAAKRGDQNPKEPGRKGGRKDIASVKALELELLDKYTRQALKGMESPCQEEVSHYCGYASATLLHMLWGDWRAGLHGFILCQVNFELGAVLPQQFLAALGLLRPPPPPPRPLLITHTFLCRLIWQVPA